MALTLDSATLAAYTAAATADARAQAVIDSLSGTVYVRVYNGAGTLMGEGTMSSPWATRSGSVITVAEVATFGVLVTGTPDASGWYLRFEDGSGHWVRGPFGPGGNFTWSAATWTSGQGGQIGTVTLNARGTIALVGAAIGQAAAGAGLTVSGGGTPLLNLTFDSGTDGANIPEFSDDSGTVYDSSQKYGGSGKSAKIQITGGGGGFGQWGGIYSFPTPLQRYDEVWVRIRVRFPTGFNWTNSDGNASMIKFLRLRNEISGSNAGYTDLYFGHPTTNGAFPTQLRYIHEAEQNWYDSAGSAAPMQPDTWHTYEAYYKLDSVKGSAGGQSRARVWFDGSVVIDTNDRITLASSSALIPYLYLFTYWNQVAPQTQHGWIDDLTVYTGASPPGNFDGSGNRFIGV